MRCVDLFSGVGGMSLGFEQAGMEVVIAIEKDPAIALGYIENLKNTRVVVDKVENIDIDLMFKPYKQQGIDVVFGGPPCQGFSQKGKRLHIYDDRNYLFRYFASVVRFLRPSFFVIENVPNILTTANRYFYQEIYEEFSKLGYLVQARTLNASEYGVPQHRRRAFIVGSLPPFRFEFPAPSQTIVTVNDAISDLPVLKAGEGEEFYPYTSPPRTEYQAQLRTGSKGYYNHQATRHSKISLERLAMIPHNGGGKESLTKDHLTKSIYSGTWTRLREDTPARTITTRFDTPSSGQFTLPRQDRCLTVREAARLQSFPDSFVFTGTKSNQMLQVGNAVPPLLAKSLAKSIAIAISAHDDRLLPV